MAAGSRKNFALDLTDIMAFPDGLNIPIRPPMQGENWVSPLEIVTDETRMNPLYFVKDINQGGPLLVELLTPDRFKDAEKFKVGHTICVTDGTFHAFPDGRNGFRVTDPKKNRDSPCVRTQAEGYTYKRRAPAAQRYGKPVEM